MPFTRTATAPNTNAKITVQVAGLMLVRQGANDTCEIGIHRFARDHTFQATLIVKKANRPPRLIRLQTGIPTSDFTMTLFNAPAPGIQAFAPTAEPFQRDDMAEDHLDYRWAFNFRSLANHAAVDFNQGAHPIATLNTGVLYTPTLSRKGQSIQQTCGATVTDLHRVAADLAFAIDLPGPLNQPGSPTMEITWSDFGRPQVLVLPRPGEESEMDTTYTLSLLNDPPFSDPPAHDELEHYYQVLERNGAPIPGLDHCRLEIGVAPNSDQIPCLPGLLES